MKSITTILVIALVAAIGWHIKEAFSADKKISGIFQEKPDLGYSWEQTTAKVGGMGINYIIEEGSRYPKIEAVTWGGPASLAGLQVGDFITSIEGLSTEGLTIDQLKRIIPGEVGSTCNILIWRNGVQYPVSFTRQRIPGLVSEAQLTNAYDPTAHFFWDDNQVVWCPGFVHPEFNVQAAEQNNTWKALPGYVLSGTKAGDLSTTWTPGLAHPLMNAFSINMEGRWVPDLGYKFITENGLATGTTWAAGTKYPEYKIIAAENAGIFNAYPGYSFSNPTRNLDVVWTPGLKDPDYPERISGPTEGEWISVPEYPSATYASTEDTWTDHLVKSVALKGLANLGEWLTNKKDNYVSNELNKKSDEELLKSAFKGLKKLTE
ncbi:MAG: PDZ domain-containing protein [Candidatus Pseudobacter hemicellulosilyticus]|uniref:PDZ domain-containing protein n=1 Tax=Candidatus Pseudobacter hemicellulosilyticus TaxID=3121375 RepID=A0AAJ5WR93_9BACT|nr:MAG: PDZ domain-containing protein [Pseudobacter sp.]